MICLFQFINWISSVSGTFSLKKQYALPILPNTQCFVSAIQFEISDEMKGIILRRN